MQISDLLDAGYKATSKVELKKPGLYLWGEFMHGDADHYSKESTEVPSVETLNALVLMLQTVMETKDYRFDKHHYRKWEEYFYSVVGEKWKEEYLYDHFLDWWPRDITCDDYRASLESWWIIFVDESGQEYKVVPLGK